MAVTDINATDLTEETTETLDGNEYAVLFDGAAGKKCKVSTLGSLFASYSQLMTKVNYQATDITDIIDSMAIPNASTTFLYVYGYKSGGSEMGLPSNENYMVACLKGSDSYLTLIMISVSATPRIYMRKKSGGIWGNYYSIVFS